MLARKMRRLGTTLFWIAVAALGGHQKNNGDPGWVTLARGYEKLRTLTEGAAARDAIDWSDV